MTVSRLDALELRPSGFAFDPRTGASFSVNATGVQIIEGLRQGQTLEAIVADLHTGWAVDDADLTRDVLEFVALLREHGLLDAHFALD